MEEITAVGPVDHRVRGEPIG